MHVHVSFKTISALFIQAELEKCMVGSDTVDPIITEIVTSKLISLHEEVKLCLSDVVHTQRFVLKIAALSSVSKGL